MAGQISFMRSWQKVETPFRTLEPGRVLRRRYCPFLRKEGTASTAIASADAALAAFNLKFKASSVARAQAVPDAWWTTIVPCSFDNDASHVRVAGFRDASVFVRLPLESLLSTTPQ